MIRRPTLSLAWLSLTLVGCSTSSSGASELPPNAYVAEGDAVRQLFRQCSRGAPVFVPSDYQPLASDILTLERRLPRALAAAFEEQHYDDSWHVTFDPDTYIRHYAAYEAGGRTMIYGNFVLKSPTDAGFDAARLSIVCDGGPDFFGIEYDVERKEITQVSFNGYIGLP